MITHGHQLIGDFLFENTTRAALPKAPEPVLFLRSASKLPLGR